MKHQEEKYEIFLSYRRDGGMDTATLLRQTLTSRGYRVFIDVESLRSGAFNKKLYEIIDNCTDFLVILPPNGLDRCSDEQDWVRLEIERAKQGGKNIIPIMLRGFEFPEELPESIDFIRYQNAPPIDTGAYYDAFVDKLTEFLFSEPELKKAQEKSRKKKLATGIAAAAIAALALTGAFLFRQPKDEAAVQRIENANPVVLTVGSSDENLTAEEKEKLQQLTQAMQNGEFREGEYANSYLYSLSNETDYGLDEVEFRAQFRNAAGAIVGSSSQSIKDWIKGDAREMSFSCYSGDPDKVEICATIKGSEKNLRTDYVPLAVAEEADPVVFTLLTELPVTISYHKYDGDLQYLITDLHADTGSWYFNNNRGSGYISIDGKYLSGPENAGGYIDFRILDADGALYQAGSISIPKLKPEDRFSNISGYISNLPAGAYLLELAEHQA